MILRSSPAGEGSDAPPEVNVNAPSSDTISPEAVKVMQEDADMTNIDLDPEAGFISQADVNSNQQMGSPTSQGFMSKYGKNDQDLLQTT